MKTPPPGGNDYSNHPGVEGEPQRPKPAPAPKQKRPAVPADSTHDTTGGRAPNKAPVVAGPTAANGLQHAGPATGGGFDAHAPVPILAAHGFNGGIESWNQRVQAVVNAHQATHGTQPSPGLVFDLARSPIPDNLIPHMVAQVPQDPRRAIIKGAAQAKSTEERAFIPKGRTPDGPHQLREWGPVIDSPENQVMQRQFEQAVKEGIITTASLPLDAAGGNAWINGLLSQKKYDYETKYGGIDVQDALKNFLLTGNPRDATLPNVEKLPQWQRDRFYQQMKVQNEANLSHLPGYADLKHMHTTKTVEQFLSQSYPDIFGDLKPSSYWNGDWQARLPRLFSDNKYKLDILKYQAEKLHYDPDASGVGQMIHDWGRRNEQLAYIAKHEPGQFWAVAGQPLQMFAKIDWTKTGGVPHTPKDLLAGIEGSWQFVSGGTGWKGWSVVDLPIPVLSGLWHGVQLGFDETSAYYNDFAAKLAAANAVLQNHFLPGLLGGHETSEQLHARVRQALLSNPTLLNVVTGGLVTDKNEPGWAKTVDLAATVAIQLWMGKKYMGPGYYELPLQNLDAAYRDYHLYGSAKLAYNNLKHGDLGQAVAEAGGMPAERFIVAAARQKSLSFKDFHRGMVEMYAKGRTTFADGKTVEGHVATHLLRREAPKAGAYTMGAKRLTQQARFAVRDSFAVDQLLKVPGAAHAVSFVDHLGQLVSIAAPERGAVRGLYDPQLPNNVYRFVVQNGLADKQKASELRDSFIKARAGGQQARLADLVGEIHDLYYSKFERPMPSGEPGTIFDPQLETEGLGQVRFPTGTKLRPLTPGEHNKAESVVRAFKQSTINTSDTLNKWSRVWRQQILDLGPGLTYKHAATDPMAAWLGGATFTRDAETAAAAKSLMDETPALSRVYSASRARTVRGEGQYLRGEVVSDGGVSSFRLHNGAGNGSIRDDKAAVASAAQHLRRMIDSEAVAAFRRSTPDNLDPLTKLLFENKTIKALFFNATELTPKLRAVEKSQQLSLLEAGKPLRGETPRFEPGAPADLTSNVDKFVAGKLNRAELTSWEADQYAQMIFNRYTQLLEDGKAAGFDGAGKPDVIAAAQKVLSDSRGPKMDAALAGFIRSNKIELDVKDRKILRDGWFDEASGKLINAYLVANKWSRSKLFDTVFEQSFKAMREAGFTDENALANSVFLAEQQTIHHMLDFGKTLNVEQKFRWALPFVVKRRLSLQRYAHWLRQYPLAGPAVVSELGQHVDQSGNINFEIAGMHMTLPLSRLMFLSEQDTPAQIPIARAFGLDQVAGGGGFTRVDTPAKIAVNVALMATGVHAWTYENAVAGLSGSQRSQMNVRVNAYIAEALLRHKKMPSLQSAIQYAVLHQGLEQAYNSMFLFPVSFQPPGMPDEVRAAQKKYDSLQADPRAARSYFAANPAVGLAFGQYQDPNVFQQSQRMYEKENQLRADRDKTLKTVYDRATANRQFTTKDLKEIANAKTRYISQIDQLVIEDAATWKGAKGFPAGVVVGGKVTQPGPFGASIQGDPLQSYKWIEQTFGLSSKELNKHVWGPDQVQIQAQLDWLSSPGAATVYKHEYGTDWQQRLASERGIYAAALAPFKSAPKDKIAVVYSRYMEHYHAFFSQLQKLRDQVNMETGPAKQAAQDQQRLYVIQHDNGGTLLVNGDKVKVPSYIAYHLARMTPDYRRQWLAQNVVTKQWESLAPDEKRAIGYTVDDPRVDEGWIIYHQWITEYKASAPFGHTVNAADRKYYAQHVDAYLKARGVTGFFADWSNTLKPKYQLLQQATPFTQSPHKDLWLDRGGIFDYANQQYTAMRSQGYTQTQMHHYWITQAVPYIKTIIGQHPDFEKEVAMYGPAFLNSLIAHG